jgi:ribosome-binding protein aMBF1 (putative translation factor)
MQNKNELLTQFGMRIREMRKEQSFSQEELAARAQIDRTYLRVGHKSQ